MARQSIDSLKPQANVDEIYRVIDKQLRTNRQGSLYLLMQLSDKTGAISAMRWNASQLLYDSFQKGDYLRVQATAQLHNGSIQLIVQDFDTVDPSRIDLAEFDALDRKLVARNWERLLELVSTIQRPALKHLAHAFCDDDTIRNAFQLAPAGIKAHHAKPGGLLVHVLNLMELVDRMTPCYPQVDRDLLLLGAMLHDIGKLEELTYQGELGYSDPGQLIGHLVQGVQMLDWKAIEVAEKTGTPIEPQLLWRLQHMIVSHHGTLEHGSPKVPMTLEAILLHYIDDLDAKMNSASELILSDMAGDPNWTTFNPMLGRKIYKPSYVDVPLT